MLASMGLKESDIDNLYLGAFSAGGSTLRHLLNHEKDRAMVRAVMLHDATYTHPSPAPIEPFVKYALDTVGTNKLMLATVSNSPNGQAGSGSDVLRETRKEIERRLGKSFTQGGALPVSDQPLTLHSLGPNVLFADYGGKGGGHGYHPKMAPEMWQQVLQPWLAGSGPAPPGPLPPGPVPPGTQPVLPPTGEDRMLVIGSLLVGTALGYGAVLVVESVMERGT
jgi:hypothetical protein